MSTLPTRVLSSTLSCPLSSPLSFRRLRPLSTPLSSPQPSPDRVLLAGSLLLQWRKGPSTTQPSSSVGKHPHNQGIQGKLQTHGGPADDAAVWRQSPGWPQYQLFNFNLCPADAPGRFRVNRFQFQGRGPVRQAPERATLLRVGPAGAAHSQQSRTFLKLITVDMENTRSVRRSVVEIGKLVLRPAKESPRRPQPQHLILPWDNSRPHCSDSRSRSHLSLSQLSVELSHRSGSRSRVAIA